MRIILYTLGLIFVITSSQSMAAEGTHALAMHGTPKYPSDFQHFDTVNPDAPKGGDIRLSAIGTFDSLNPFITKGIAAASLGLIYTPIMVASDDEAFTKYGALAHNIIMPDDRSSLTIQLHKQAQWHDGQPVTADDVVWTFNTLMKDGAPFYQAYYANVKAVDALDKHTVKFTFDGTDNLELPLILGQMMVLPKHFWAERDFTATSMDLTLGSGPYRITNVDPGRSVTYERVDNWWGADLPVYRGHYNFDTITVEYYRDPTVALEAFLAGEYDFRRENTAKVWATAYNNDAVERGDIVMNSIPHAQPAGMQAFIMNTRKPVFADREVRRALQYAFDFEWSNKQFAFSSYTRTNSYFENSELASSGLPEGEELAILTDYSDLLPPELFTEPFTVPETKGNGRNRSHLSKAAAILTQAGYITGADGIRVHNETGQRLSFEIIDNQAAFERWTLPMIRNLKRLGIEATFRVIDDAQLVNRLASFDFDMTIHSFGQSDSPGNEQREFWHSSKADIEGSRNLMGIKDPAIDALIDLVIAAPDRQSLITRTRALDRALLHGYYLIPQWHINAWRVAYWDKFGQPANPSQKSLNVLTSWWIKE